MSDNIQIPQQELTDIVNRAKRLESTFNKRGDLFKRYREMYFMDNIEKPSSGQIDRHDWKLTASPSARNEVIGMKRLLDTSDMHVKVLENGNASKKSDMIERGLKKILDVSGEGKQARVESDAMLSAVLYGPVVLGAEALQDLLSVKALPEYKRMHYQKIQKKTPFLIKALNPEEHFAEIDEGLVILSEWKYKLTGAKIKSRYKVSANDLQEYDVRDIFTPEYHIITIDGIGHVFAKPHGLGCVPVVVSLSGGTELFHTPEEQLNSFLYAKAKAELDKRENMILTALFTQLNKRGLLGTMYWIDPETAPDNITIDYQNGVMFAKGKVSAQNDQVIDPVVFQIKNMLDDLSGQSTIYKQTLGENINAGTFSGLAMLSSAGKLPLVDPQRALENAFRDIFVHILYRIKQEGIENELIPPAEIPNDLDIVVTFEPKLPQDNLRNSQMAVNLGDLVSDEWKLTNLLQEGDAAAMQRQVAKEKIFKSMLARAAEDPQSPIMQQLMSMVFSGLMGGGGGPTPPAPNMQPSPAPAPNMQPGYSNDPAQGQMNMESPGMMDAMTPPQELM